MFLCISLLLLALNYVNMFRLVPYSSVIVKRKATLTRKLSQKVVDSYGMEESLLKCLTNLQISPKSTILLAISGGSDSMAMLHLMKSVQQSVLKELQLKIVNFNHKKRKEADEEVMPELFLDCFSIK
jgi:3'-phosphoadenosine 5'-phosphosulfate sulfotransferase (PAPS reductase)/FAD synthetase